MDLDKRPKKIGAVRAALIRKLGGQVPEEQKRSPIRVRMLGCLDRYQVMAYGVDTAIEQLKFDLVGGLTRQLYEGGAITVKREADKDLEDRAIYSAEIRVIPESWADKEVRSVYEYELQGGDPNC